MSTLRLPGLLTGIDTSALITQLMALERRSLNVYKERKSMWEERQDALSTLETKLENLRSPVQSLSDADELRAFSVASSDTDKLTADASYNAFEGNHNVVINQLATAERNVHTTGLEYAEDYVGAGTFIYSYNHQETSITTTATTTLEDMVGLINNDANNPGVTASLLYYNNAYHLVLNGNSAGTDYKISINPSSTETWEADSAFTDNSENATLSTKIVNLDQFSGTPDDDDVIEITGTDRNGVAITQVDLSITDNTRIEHLIGEINDAFDGIAKAVLKNGKIILTDNTYGTSDLSISLNYNHGGNSSSSLTLPTMAFSTEGGNTSANLTGFAATDFIETQSAQDSKIKVDGYPATTAVAEEQRLTPTAVATDGTFTLTYDGQTTAAINYNATTTDIQTALEALSNVSSGDITVDGTALDTAGATTFTFLNTAGDVDMISIDPTSLTPSARSNYVMAEQTKGQDGYISRSSNTVDDVIYGVALHLHDTTTATGEEITLTRDIQSVKDKLSKMVDAYNLAVEFIKEKTGFNDVLKTAGLLMGDYIVSIIKQQIRTPLITQTNGFIEDIDTFLTPGHLGFNIDREGLLSLDMNVLDEAIAEDYMGVLAIIGADKTGSSDSNTIEFYGASSNYTTAGNYDVEVEVSSGALTSAKIKLSTESTYRNATYSGNIVTGDSTFDDNGVPTYPENALQLSVDLSQDGTFTATVRVKQGFTGAIEDALDKMLKVTTGSIQIDQKHVDNQIDALQGKIESEEDRLTKKEDRLIARFARLERNLALIQQQMSALGIGV
ncbi:MAG: flagellar filament capping protein FliD [Planctomycetes bacterium]|nr:flagellar filament capping protein FliD [Planctomycetota bacterium]